MRRLHQIARGDLQRLRQGVIQRLRRIAAFGAGTVFCPQMGGVMARDQREGGLPFIGHPPAEDRGQRALGIQINHQHAVAVQRRRHRQMRTGRGLADAALEIGHGDDLGGQAFGAVGQVVAVARALGPEMRTQAQHLIQGEPFRAAFGFGPPLRQAWVLLQHAAEMRGCDRDQIAGDLPCRKETQAFAPLGIKPARGQICPALIAGRRNCRQILGAQRRRQFRQSRVQWYVEIGRQIGG